MNVTEVMAKTLHQWGIRDIFGVSGSSFLPFLEAIRRDGTLSYLHLPTAKAGGF